MRYPSLACSAIIENYDFAVFVKFCELQFALFLTAVTQLAPFDTCCRLFRTTQDVV